jgi:putative nucleotidyltransferase with HDIG domain
MMAVDCSSGLVLEANPAAAALMDCDSREIAGRSLCDLFIPQERPRLDEVLAKGRLQNASLDEFHIRQGPTPSFPVLVSTLATKGPDGVPILLCVLRRFDELERQHHRLATLRWALNAHAEAALALVRAESSHGLLQAICDSITREFAYVLAWVGCAEEDEQKSVRVLAASGPAQSYLEGLSVTWDESSSTGQGPTGQAIRSGQLQIMEDSETSPFFAYWRERATGFGIYSSVTVPLVVEGLWRGALMVYAGYRQAFEPLAIEVFEDLAREISHGVQALHRKELLESETRRRAQAQQKLTEAFASIVSALVAAVEARDPYTAGHQSRVAELACAIAGEMGWDETRITTLRMAAMVHDIGKISVPSRILIKPGRLTEEELELIRLHPETGYNILKDIPFEWPVAEIMRQHHEKRNGSGYPRALKEEEILPEARVLAVADIVEAMASDRPYRSAIPLAEVLSEIENQAGVLLDEEAVQACLRLFRKRGYVLPR